MLNPLFRKKRDIPKNYEHHLLQSSAFYAGMFTGILGSTIIFIIERYGGDITVKGSLKYILALYNIPDFLFTVAFNLGAAMLTLYLFIFYNNLKKTISDESNPQKDEGDV